MTRLGLNPSRTLNLLDDLDLEARRLASLRAGDEGIEAVVVVLCVRAVPVIERVCRERGASRGIHPERTLLAIEDAAARLALKLYRLAPLPPIGAIAAQLAAACTDAQPIGDGNRNQLAVRRPNLVLVRDLVGEHANRGHR
jgi:hypothetical protein